MTGRLSGRMYPDSERVKHFRMSKCDADYAGFDDDMGYVEVRYDGAGYADEQGRPTVDEIVMPGLHLEVMDEDAVWMGVGGLHVWLRAVRVKGQRKLRIEVTCEPNACKPYVVPAEEATGDSVSEARQPGAAGEGGGA